MSRRGSRTGAQVGTPPRVLSGIVKVILTVTYLVPLLWIVIEAFKSDNQSLTAPDALIFAPTLATFRTVIGTATGSVSSPSSSPPSPLRPSPSWVSRRRTHSPGGPRQGGAG